MLLALVLLQGVQDRMEQASHQDHGEESDQEEGDEEESEDGHMLFFE